MKAACRSQLSFELLACTYTRPCCARQADAVTGRTTNFQRTIGTLQGVLTGLYPDTREAIPVTTAADLDEVLFANVQGCMSLQLAMDAAKNKVQGGFQQQVLCSAPGPAGDACIVAVIAGPSNQVAALQSHQQVRTREQH